MGSVSPTRDIVLEAVDGLGPPGTPVTTPEVAERFDCTRRTIYNRLTALVEAGRLETKKVGANSRVWWQPVDGAIGRNGTAVDELEAGPLSSESSGQPEGSAPTPVNGARFQGRHAASTARLEGLVAATSDIVYRMSPDWSTLYYLDGQGIVPDTVEPRESWLEEYLPVDEQPRVISAVETGVEEGSVFELEHEVRRVDGTRGWLHSRAVPIVNDAGEIVEWLGTASDVTERKRMEREQHEHETALNRLDEMAQDLIDIESAAIADRIAPLMRTVLDSAYAKLWRYDDQRGELEEYDVDTAPKLNVGPIDVSDDRFDRVWETFVGADTGVVNDLDDTIDDASPLASQAFVPLGRHGIVELGSTRSDEFDDRTVEFVRIVAAIVKTAWDRATAERELTARSEELTRLARFNTLVRAIGQAVVRADTRAELDDAVCERLIDSDRYEFAWIGAFDAATDAVQPRSWAGVDSGTVEDLAAAGASENATSPFVTAVRTGEIQVIDDIVTDTRTGSWQEAALNRGARSCFTIPLTYDDSVYGVLVAYGDTPASGHDETEVLAELGQTIAHAINAVETRDTVQADSVVELTLQSTAADTPLCRLARATDRQLEFEGLVPRTDGEATVFFTALEATAEQVIATGEEVLGIEAVSRLGDRDGGSLFKTRLSEPSLARLVLERKATIQWLRIDAESATIVVDLPRAADVREFVEGLTREVPSTRQPRWYPDLELLARRTRTREPTTTLQSAVLDRLTARQQEVLQLAYRSGYFETPRVQTGEELAEALDIVPSTFTKHIRGAERNLLDVVFERANELPVGEAK